MTSKKVTLVQTQKFSKFWEVAIISLIHTLWRHFQIEGTIFFQKGQLQGRLKQFNLEQDPGCNFRYQGVFTIKTMMAYICQFFSNKLKSTSHLPKKFLFICFNESLLNIMKNAFYFILKALFVLKIFKFLSSYFGHVEEMAWLER